MMRCVIDTNVPIVANNRGTNPSIECRIAAISFLKTMARKGTTILDLEGAIQSEYRRYLNPKGQPGVGDQFYRMILMSHPERVERISISWNEIRNDYDDFPTDAALTGLHRSDRKFVAAAAHSGAPVVSATDRGWLQHRAGLRANGISVEFICGCDPDLWVSDA